MKKFLTGLSLNTRSLIAYLVVIGSFTFLFRLAEKEVPPANKDVLNTAAGLILGTLATVVGFYFGSSKNETDANNAVNAVATASTITNSSTTTTTTTQAPI